MTNNTTGKTIAPGVDSLDKVNNLAIDIHLQRTDFSLTVKKTLPLNGITGIFGQSGSGKSSLLRIICGLENNATGTLQLNNTTLFDSPIASKKKQYLKAEHRGIGLVFQDTRLFPHLTVEQNLLFAIKRRSKHKLFANRRQLNYQEIVKATKLTPLLNKQDSQLSGGEKQRVALARALLATPKLLLLDEPFSALDHQHKSTLLILLCDIQQQFNIPMIYVSHALEELQQITDHVLVLKQGKVTHWGDTHRVIAALNRGGNQQTPIMTSLTLFLNEQLPQYGLSKLALTAEQAIFSPLISPPQHNKHNKLSNNSHLPSGIRCLIYASDISITLTSPDKSSVVNQLAGTIIAIKKQAQQVLLTVNCFEHHFFVNITLWSYEKLNLVNEQQVYIQFKAGAVRTLANQSMLSELA